MSCSLCSLPSPTVASWDHAPRRAPRRITRSWKRLASGVRVVVSLSLRGENNEKSVLGGVCGRSRGGRGSSIPHPTGGSASPVRLAVPLEHKPTGGAMSVVRRAPFRSDAPRASSSWRAPWHLWRILGFPEVQSEPGAGVFCAAYPGRSTFLSLHRFSLKLMAH